MNTQDPPKKVPVQYLEEEDEEIPDISSAVHRKVMDLTKAPPTLRRNVVLTSTAATATSEETE
jgi:hypothetical protein